MTEIHEAEARLYNLWGEISDLQSTQELLDWDQETYMPGAAHEARARMCGTLAGVKHRMMTDDSLWESLLECRQSAQADSVLAHQVRVAERELSDARKIPEALARALAEARSRGTAAWQKARQEGRFEIFQPALEELVRLTREEAAALSPSGPAYDALIGKFEPGMTEDQLVPIFDALVGELVPLVRAIGESESEVDESAVLGHFPEAGQRALAIHAARGLGFSFESGRLDLTAHPFCIGIAPSDVRLTWRFDEGDVRSGLFGVLHEAGHGLYEQGLPAEWWRKPLGAAVSLGIHESQSRLVENQIGRHRGFWRWLWPAFLEHFPDAASSSSAEQLWPSLHVVRPSLIRVEADETTYNLHVAVRFHLERALFRGDLEVADLPEAWDDAYEEMLGVRAQNPVDGVLQDIHWSQAIFGYFPTYTLGSLNAAQLFEAARRDLGLEDEADLEEALARGELTPIRDWLRENVHAHGSRYDAAELIERATGAPPSPDALLRSLRRHAREIYGVE
ncbi:MAG: carboxypeptidase M32 [Acidobacteriota bacterium]